MLKVRPNPAPCEPYPSVQQHAVLQSLTQVLRRYSTTRNECCCARTGLSRLVNDATVSVDDGANERATWEDIFDDQEEDDDGGGKLGEVRERTVRAVELPGCATLDHDDGRPLLWVRRVFVVAEVSVGVECFVDGHVGAEVLVRAHDQTLELHWVCAQADGCVSEAAPRHACGHATHKS